MNDVCRNHFLCYSRSTACLLLGSAHFNKYTLFTTKQTHCSPLTASFKHTQDGALCLCLPGTLSSFIVISSRKHRANHPCTCSHDPVGFPQTSPSSEAPADDFVSDKLNHSILPGLDKRSEYSEALSYPSSEVLKASHETVDQLIDQGVDVENKGVLQQMYDIVMFAGPALGIWLSGPIMSMIDTAVVGNSSLVELAALGPGTVFCDNLGYAFMFLAVATSNLIATSMAKQDKNEAANHLSRLLFVGLVCGICMLIFTGAFSSTLLRAFVGSKNESLLPAASSYVQIRGLAWPAVLVGLVAQSASLGMQDAWGPLKVLSIASMMNFIGDILFCTVLKHGIAGAAWATAISQWVGGCLLLKSLGEKGYNPLGFTVPSVEEFSYMLQLAAPVLVTILSKVCFFSYVTYITTALGAVTLAAHQVMVGLFGIFSVSAEPLNQTAQSFMPGLIQGSRRNVKKAQMLLRSLLVIGAFSGVLLGALGTSFSWIFPHLFTKDTTVIMRMRAITLPFLWGLMITPPLLALEGTLMAGRDLRYLSLSMVACVLGGSSLLVVSKRLQLGLEGIWWTLACFQTIRFCMALHRLTSRYSVIRDSSWDSSTLNYWKPT